MTDDLAVSLSAHPPHRSRHVEPGGRPALCHTAYKGWVLLDQLPARDTKKRKERWRRGHLLIGPTEKKKKRGRGTKKEIVSYAISEIPSAGRVQKSKTGLGRRNDDKEGELRG